MTHRPQAQHPQAQQHVPGRPTHPDVDKLADAMRRANEFTDAGGNPEKAVGLWVDPDMLLVHARVAQKPRFNGELPKDRTLVVTSHAAYMYGFVTARLFREPDRSMTTANRTSKAANPFLKAGNSPERQQFQDIMGKFSAGPDLMVASAGVDQLLSDVTDPASFRARISTLVDVDSLNWVASQAAMVANGIVTAGDLMTMRNDSKALARFAECQLMFMDAFLLGWHFPTRS